MAFDSSNNNNKHTKENAFSVQYQNPFFIFFPASVTFMKFYELYGIIHEHVEYLQKKEKLLLCCMFNVYFAGGCGSKINYEALY